MISAVYAGKSSNPSLNRLVGGFVSTLIFGRDDAIEKYCSMAVFDGSRLIAGVLYNNYYPEQGVIELHAASTDKRWITRPVLKAMFALPFEQFKCQMCVLRVSENNKSMIRIAKAYGFNAYSIPRLRGKDEGECIMTLTDDDWRNNRFNRKEQ